VGSRFRGDGDFILFCVLFASPYIFYSAVTSTILWSLGSWIGRGACRVAPDGVALDEQKHVSLSSQRLPPKEVISHISAVYKEVQNKAVPLWTVITVRFARLLVCCC
jgi:hypothetical protein